MEALTFNKGNNILLSLFRITHLKTIKKRAYHESVTTYFKGVIIEAVLVNHQQIGRTSHYMKPV